MPTHKIVRNSFVRPSNTTAYVAGDSVSTSETAPSALKLANVVSGANGAGKIERVRFAKSDLAAVPEFRIWFFTQLVAATNDNAAIEINEADLDYVIGYVDITPVAMTDYAQAWADVNMPFNSTDGDDDIYALLEVNAGYTPVSAEEFWIEVSVEQRV